MIQRQLAVSSPPIIAMGRAPRWWESAREGRVFCGPEPIGHHFPASFDINESGFVQCSARLALPEELERLKRLREAHRYALADQLEATIRSTGAHVPALAQLRAMSRDMGRCGNWVFLFAIRGGGTIVARVTPDERRAMKRLSTPAEMIEYLEIFPQRGDQ